VQAGFLRQTPGLHRLQFVERHQQMEILHQALPLKLSEGMDRVVWVLPRTFAAFPAGRVNARFFRKDADGLLDRRMLRVIMLELFRNPPRLDFCFIQLKNSPAGRSVLRSVAVVPVQSLQCVKSIPAASATSRSVSWRCSRKSRNESPKRADLGEVAL